MRLSGPMSEDASPPAAREGGYAALLADLRAIIAAGRGRAAAAVNAEIVATYWRIGQRIVREEQGGAARAGYGEQLPAYAGQRQGPRPAGSGPPVGTDPR